MKNVVITDEKRKVVFLSDTYEGRVHDKTIADDERYQVPEGSQLYQDMGFQGFQMEGVEIMQPKKKPKGEELTDEEKEKNREISSVRIGVEHVINGIKRCRILKEKCRLWRDDVRDKLMETCCGLHNFRVLHRINDPQHSS